METSREPRTAQGGRARTRKGAGPGPWVLMTIALIVGACADAQTPSGEPARAPDGETPTAEPAGGTGSSPASPVAQPGSPGDAPSGADPASSPADEPARLASTEPVAQPDPEPDPRYPATPPRFERPQHVRGIYLNAWAAGSRRKVGNLLASVEGTEINTFVIDLKDASGFVSHRSKVPMVAEIGADRDLRVGDLNALLWTLAEAGIYPIARIVIVKDPNLTGAHPELAVQDTAGGPWVDGKGQVWVNPYHRVVWEYHVDLAREAAAAGFPEIQWDYVRFPDAPRSEIARTAYPGSEGRSRSAAIRELLEYTRSELAPLGVTVTADVFGVTTSATGDVGIGQVWEEFIDVVDVALPMVYPSHYWKGSFGYERPNAYPYEIVYEALVRAQDRSARVAGAGSVRPWLQDFTLGKPPYGPEHVRAQIQATYDAGITEWILWNPGSRYTSEAFAPAGGYPEGAEPLIPVADTVLVASAAKTHLARLREAAAAAAEAARAVVPPPPPGTAASDSSGVKR